MQRVHLVALADELEVGGDEEDFYAPVFFPDALCQLYAGDGFHLDVEYKDVVGAVLRIGEEEGLRGGECAHLKGEGRPVGPL